MYENMLFSLLVLTGKIHSDKVSTKYGGIESIAFAREPPDSQRLLLSQFFITQLQIAFIIERAFDDEDSIVFFEGFAPISLIGLQGLEPQEVLILRLVDVVLC